MTPEAFCYWLQGFLELSNAKSLDAEQLAQVRKHLALVLTNVTGSPEKVRELKGLVGRLPQCGHGVRLC